MINVIEVQRYTKSSRGRVGILTAVKCVIDGQERIMSSDEWRELVHSPDVNVSLSKREGVID